MGRLTVRLPDTLHQHLVSLAKEEGVSLNQFIVYALTRQVTLAQLMQSSSESLQQQEAAYTALLKNLGQASVKDVHAMLNERGQVYLAPTLTVEAVQQLIAMLPLWEQILGVSTMAKNEKTSSAGLTVGQLRESGLIGLWEDREDIEDSTAYARRLREQAQQRGDVAYDSTR